MKLLPETIKAFLFRKQVQFILFIIIIEFVVLVVLSLLFPWLDIPLEFIVELSGVGIGIFLGFEFNRLWVSIRLARARKKTFYLFIDELEENKKGMVGLYVSRTADYTAYMLKTTVWEIYKEKLGDASIENVSKLTDIYHNIMLINDNIKHIARPGEHPMAERIRQIISDTSKDIDEWIKIIKDFYEKDNIEK